jgi:hypothetical protein
MRPLPFSDGGGCLLCTGWVHMQGWYRGYRSDLVVSILYIYISLRKKEGLVLLVRVRGLVGNFERN